MYDACNTMFFPLFTIGTGMPLEIKAARINFTNIVVSWADPAPISASRALYEVFWRKDNTPLSNSAGNTSNTQLTLTGLTLRNGYFVYVVPLNNNNSSPSNTVHIEPGVVIYSTNSITLMF